MTLALEAIDVRDRDVIVPALTYIATAEAVVHAGGRPYFCDVDPETWLLTPASIQWTMYGDPNDSDLDIAAIVPVHLFGNVAAVDLLRQCFVDVPIVEDACQAVGSAYKTKRAGSLGDIAAFSFYPSKMLAAAGDGGAVTTNNPALAESVRLLRSHGSFDNREHHLIGTTARLDEIQAAILNERLNGFSNQLARSRRRLPLGDQVPTQGARPNGYRIVKLTTDEAPIWTLAGYDTGPVRYYDPPAHQQPSMRAYYRRPLPVAEDFGRRNYVVEGDA